MSQFVYYCNKIVCICRRAQEMYKKVGSQRHYPDQFLSNFYDSVSFMYVFINRYMSL